MAKIDKLKKGTFSDVPFCSTTIELVLPSRLGIVGTTKIFLRNKSGDIMDKLFLYDILSQDTRFTF